MPAAPRGSPRRPRARPVPAQRTRPRSRSCPSPSAERAIRYPSPSAPRRFAAATSQPSKTSSAAGQPRMPIFRSCAPNRNPAAPFSTRKAVMPAASGLRIHRREHEVTLCLRGVGDPDLRARQPVRLRRVDRPHPLRPRPDRGRIGSRMRFGQGKRPQRLPGLHRREPARALVVRAPGHDRVLRQDVDGERHGHRHVRRAKLLHDQRPSEVREPGSSDRRREWRRGQAQRAHRREQRAVVALGLVALDRARGDLPLGELASGRLEQSFLVRQRRAHAG